MKTTVIESKDKDLEFPLLAKTILDGNEKVVLFISKEEGVLLSEEVERYGIGYFCKEWTSCTDESVWQILESPVTIKFEF